MVSIISFIFAIFAAMLMVGIYTSGIKPVGKKIIIVALFIIALFALFKIQYLENNASVKQWNADIYKVMDERSKTLSKDSK